MCKNNLILYGFIFINNRFTIHIYLFLLFNIDIDIELNEYVFQRYRKFHPQQ